MCKSFRSGQLVARSAKRWLVAAVVAVGGGGGSSRRRGGQGISQHITEGLHYLLRNFGLNSEKKGNH